MMRRVVSRSLGAAGLLLVVAALWLPDDLSSRGQADPAAEPATSDVRLLGGECAFFVTFRPADFTSDELIKTIVQDLPRQIEAELHVASYGVERLTLTGGRHGTVQIVRTRRAYDADKIRTAMANPRYGRYAEKFTTTEKTTTTGKATTTEKGGDGPRGPAMNDKKVGGRRIYYVGRLSPWTTGWCPIDRNTFLQGNVAAVEALLTSKGKPSAAMADAMALASTHSLVMALDGKRLRTMLRQSHEDTKRQREEWEKKSREQMEKMKEDFKDKEGFKGDRPPAGTAPAAARIAPRARVAAAADDKPRDETDDLDLLFESREGVALLPVKPILGAKFSLLTLDVKKTYTLAARVEFNDKEDVDDGETVLKALLYFGRELAVLLPKQDREFMAMKPLSAPVRKAFKDAKVQREGTTLSTTITLTPEPGMARKVRDAIAEERKKWEKKYPPRDKGGFKDKRYIDKAPVTDKRGFDKPR